MKKLLAVIGIMFIMTGCSLGNMDNTPTKKVESYLNDYQTLNSNVLTELDSLVNQEEMFDEDQKVTYRDIMKKHYQDLTYIIKEETVNGDIATVEVEIEVNDYTKAIKEANDYKMSNESEFLNDEGVFDDNLFNTYKLGLLKDAKERVKYTIYFSLTKTDNEWVLNELTETEQDKMLGIYEY